MEVLESAFVNEKGLARRLREKGELLEPVEGPVTPSDSASDSTEFSENADTLRAAMTSTMDTSPGRLCTISQHVQCAFYIQYY